MPAKNVLKQSADDSYYHVYARGGNKQKIFVDAADYRHFLALLDRYLGTEQVLSKTGEPYPNFRGHAQLLAYCLMGNHFHLLIYQREHPYLEKLMRSLMTSYSRYFNLRHGRTGPVFESRYKAVRIDSEAYLQHISRYIHLNPQRWEHYRHSSLRYYRDGHAPAWLHTQPILDIFGSQLEYLAFTADYEAQRNMLAEIKRQLADQ